MRSRFATLPLALAGCAALTACADGSPAAPVGPAALAATSHVDPQTPSRFTLALIGDTPYGAVKLAEFPRLVAQINADTAVRFVVHLGDIKSGSNSPCTDAYFATVRSLFDGFDDPFVYTPGDNEWTDCHTDVKNNGFYKPTERLQAVRSLFFPEPGRTLGVNAARVATQANDPNNAAYVENTMWAQSRVVFATLNITGSNNDLIPWGSVPTDSASNAAPSQAAEYASRAHANAAWLDRAFAAARESHAAGIVLGFQADMWDPAESTLSGFDALVRRIGVLAAEFGKPVMLLEGDSHAFRVDHPYAAGSPLRLVHPDTPVAENVTRLVVEGSSGRTEYVRFTVDSHDPANARLFSWERVPLQ